MLCHKNHLIALRHFELQHVSIRVNQEYYLPVDSARRHHDQVVGMQPSLQFHEVSVEQRNNRAAVIRQPHQSFHRYCFQRNKEELNWLASLHICTQRSLHDKRLITQCSTYDISRGDFWPP